MELEEAQRWAMTLGPRLRVIRRSLDVAASELAAAIGVEETSIYRWEVGVQRIPLRRVYQVVAALGIQLSDLMEDM